MSCQVSTGKSGSSWLDRLRTAKGFADHDAPTDLEKFLQNPKSPDTETACRKPNSASLRDPPQNQGKHLFDITSNVLNELFNFGDRDGDSTNLARSSRKQKNPRICAIASSRTRGNGNATTPLRVLDGERENELEKFDNEVRDGSLVGFSRTEVTVIDTSYESWKSEKFLYRKKNVWKVRDKKAKSGVLGSKMKRKSNGDNHCGKKSNADKNEGCEFPWIEKNISDVHKMAPNEVGETLKNKHSDLEPKERASSVILIKSVHTSTKNGPSIPKSCLPPKQKKT